MLVTVVEALHCLHAQESSARLTAPVASSTIVAAGGAANARSERQFLKWALLRNGLSGVAVGDLLDTLQLRVCSVADFNEEAFF